MNPLFNGRTVHFGAFQLDVRTGELRKGGVRINLPAQPVFDRLRSDRRCAAVLERVGLPR